MVKPSYCDSNNAVVVMLWQQQLMLVKFISIISCTVSMNYPDPELNVFSGTLISSDASKDARGVTCLTELITVMPAALMVDVVSLAFGGGTVTEATVDVDDDTNGPSFILSNAKGNAVGSFACTEFPSASSVDGTNTSRGVCESASPPGLNSLVQVCESAWTDGLGKLLVAATPDCRDSVGRPDKASKKRIGAISMPLTGAVTSIAGELLLLMLSAVGIADGNMGALAKGSTDGLVFESDCSAAAASPKRGALVSARRIGFAVNCICAEGAIGTLLGHNTSGRLIGNARGDNARGDSRCIHMASAGT